LHDTQQQIEIGIGIGESTRQQVVEGVEQRDPPLDGQQPVPGRQIRLRPCVKDRNQLRPGSIAVGKLLQVFPQPLPEPLLTHDRLQLAHHDRRLVVNDIAVHLPGLVEVGQDLANRVGTPGAVDTAGGRVVVHQEIQGVIDLGKPGVNHLVRHEIGENLLGPDIVEPLHGHQVTEPHMRSFMGDKLGPGKLIRQRRILIEKQAGGPVLNCTDVLHTAVLETGQQDEIKLLKGIVDAGVTLEPGQGIGVQ
jgi:hypothetical protein